MRTRRLWCETALLPEGFVDGVAIGIDDGRIVAVTEIAAPRPDEERLGGVTVPGFANAHSHAFHRGLRGATHGGVGDFWTWRKEMYALASRLTPDTYRDLAEAVFAEMVLAGFTCVGEFHYLHHGGGGEPYAHPNEMGDALAGAARAAGIRMTLLDACYLQGGLDGGHALPLDAVQARFSDRDVGRWCARVDALGDGDELVRHGAAIHSVRAVAPHAIRAVADHAAAHAQVLHAHVAEQPAEHEQVIAAYGMSPVTVLAEQGALSERFTAVHATHVTAADVGVLGAHRCRCCLCPTTERDLADGIGPSVALRDAGIALCIGTDQHAVIDPFEELRGIELDSRLAMQRRGNHRPSELLAAGTAAGYRSLGWDGGRIEVGALADLTVVALDGVRLAGSRRTDLGAALVFAATGDDVREVIVGGQTVVRDHAHVRIDVAAALRNAITAVRP